MAGTKKVSEEELRKKGGKMTTEEAGHLGGQRVRELIKEGEEKEREAGGERPGERREPGEEK